MNEVSNEQVSNQHGSKMNWPQINGFQQISLNCHGIRL